MDDFWNCFKLELLEVHKVQNTKSTKCFFLHPINRWGLELKSNTDTDKDNDIENGSTKIMQKVFFLQFGNIPTGGRCNQNQIRETPVSSAVLCQPRALSILLTMCADSIFASFPLLSSVNQ